MKKIWITSLLMTLLLPICLHADETKALEIKQIPQVDFENRRTGVSIGEYNGKGLIYAVFPDRIVVNDSNLYLSANPNLTTIKGQKHRGQLKQGMTIYYFLDKDRSVSKIVIDSVQ